MSTSRILFAAFTGDEILRESGRLPFALLFPFVAAGYDVAVYDNLRDRLTAFYKCEEPDLPHTARMSLSMPGVRYTHEIPADCADTIHLFDDPLRGALRQRWRRRVRVRFDTFAPYWLREPVLAPYSMHPAQTQFATPGCLAELRRAPRRIRALFAGDSKGYVRNRVSYPAPKLPRLEVLATLRERVTDDIVEIAGSAGIERLCSDGCVDKFVLSDSGSGVEPERWLPTLASADFFLCPPGMVMPMCHNVIEAMAVGTIPLIGYPEWFHPNLQHMQNCVVFGGRDDLVEKMRMVLALPQPQIERMRAAVVDYYEKYLRPETLVEAIEVRPERDLTVLIHTELNMARNEKKLNRRSVLMRGPSAAGPLRWIGRLLDGRVAAG